MRTVFVLLSILLVAACASGDGSPSKSGTSSSMVARAPAMTDDEAATYIADLATERMEALCGNRQGVTMQLECARDALFRGFDTTGEAKRHCDPDAAFKEMMRCAIIGSVAYDLARAAQVSTENYNWDNPSAALKETMSTASKAHLNACLQGSISAADSCIIEKLGDTLSLSDQQVSICTERANLDKSVRCLSRTFLIQKFESAIARMGSGVMRSRPRLIGLRFAFKCSPRRGCRRCIPPPPLLF